MSDREAFEAKVHAKRESKDGIFLTFFVHPDDYGQELAMLRVGAHLIVGWEEIASTSVEAIEIGGGVDGPSLPGETVAKREPATIAAPEPKERKPFHTLPLATQCAMRCEDGRFIEWLAFRHSFIWGRTLDFDGVTDHKERAAVAVRSICNINSRSELGRSNHDSDNRWRKLESEYQQWLTDQKYAGAVR